jgi:outer membrane receptor protein involved in Fe transport
VKDFALRASLRHGAASLALGASLLAVGAHAESGPPDAETAGDIIVTGSRIKADPATVAANPLQSITADDLQASGKTNLTDYLSDNPALLGSATDRQVAGSNLPSAALTGVNFLNLRNLGANRTLVLVDGKRHVAGYAGASAVDIGSIPTDLVEQVDVLTGGVSALYGADAVSGVVNFVLKKDYHGLRLRAQNGISERGDAGQRFISVTAGQNFADGRGNLAFAYEFQESDQFRQTQREPIRYLVPNPDAGPNQPDHVFLSDVRWAGSSRAGALYLGAVGFFPGPQLNGDGTFYDGGEYLSDLYTIGGSSTERAGYYGDYTPYSRRHNANLIGRFEFSPAFTLHAEVKMAKSKAVTEGQPNYDAFTVLLPGNAYLYQFLASGFGSELAEDFVQGGALISRDHYDFGRRRFELDRELWRTVIGASGKLSDHLQYDASFVFGQSKQVATNYNDRIFDRYYAALDAVDDGQGGITCRVNLSPEIPVIGGTYTDGFGPLMMPKTFQSGECVPLNILGEGSPSPEALDFILADHSSRSRLRQYVASFNLTGDSGAFFNLPAGPVQFAVGAEYRKESSGATPSDLQAAGDIMNFPVATVARGAFDVTEFYGELRLPILADAPMAEQLSVGGALRLSDYSSIGSTTTWNLNALYAPVAGVNFRATLSQSVRAPSISELYEPEYGMFSTILDPCGIDRIAAGPSNRLANCTAVLQALDIDPAEFDPNDSSSARLPGVGQGNANLAPEKAKTWTAGLVLQPPSLPNFSLSLDWYNINLRQAIQKATAQELVDFCYDQADLDNEFCRLTSRSTTTGFINGYRIQPQNVANLRTAGLDVNLRYRHDLGAKAGSLALQLSGNYLDRLSFVPLPNAAPKSEIGSPDAPAPRYSANFDLTWAKGPFSLSYGIDWHDKTRRISREDIAANPNYVDSRYIFYREKWEHELHAAYRIADQFKFYGGVHNLTDRKPDIGATAYPISAVGRYFYAGVSAAIF